ncbi:Thiol-disulfide oxidoreductase resA [Bacteroidales bacterium Barb6XT]|nr:Thiol-disulfide oxidoreductase resA [Bacteroidales bacterium Barb6XT]
MTEKELLENKDYQALTAKLNPLDKQLAALEKEYAEATPSQKADEAFVKAIEQRHAVAAKAYNQLIRSFILEHTDSYTGLMILVQSAGNSFELEEVAPLFDAFPDALKDTDIGRALNAKIFAGRRSAVGAVAPDFTSNDPDDHPVRLSTFRGKYVLLDFWASWCLPCRKENVHLVDAYQTFKGRNFEIISVSLDYPTGRKNWLNAIAKDGLTWTQVSDLKGWESDVALLYAVRNTPSNFLIDPQGVIIAKNLMGEKLHKVLGERVKE